MTDLRSKALSCLREGRVAVILARTGEDAAPPFEVLAFVNSSRSNGVRYVVDFLLGEWGCTCRDLGACAHVSAVQLVTGHESAAAKLQAVS